MKILALVTDAFGGHGGIARYNRDFLTALAQTGVATKIIVLPRFGTATAEMPPPEQVFQFPPHPTKLSYIVNAVGVAVAQSPFGAVFCGHLFMAPFAAALAAMLNAPMWLQLHGIEAWTRPSWLIRRAVERSALVLAVSQSTRGHLLEWSDIEPSRVVVLPNSVDAAFTPSSIPTSLCAKYNLQDKRVLISVGRLASADRYKGYDRVIDVLPLLRQRYPKIAYLIVGDGDDQPRLAALAKRCGVGDIVVFSGCVPQNELADHYRLADLFVLPSKGEGFGIVYLEAMACGTPALGLTVGGATEALCHGELGIAVNDERFDEALLEALDKPRPDPWALSQAVHSRFGERAFRAQVARILSERL